MRNIEKVFAAARRGDLGTVHLALAEGMSVDTRVEEDAGQTLLHYAVYYGHGELVAYLLAKGAAIDGRDNFGQSGLHKACAQGRLDLIELLVLRGAEVDVRDNFRMTPFNEAIYTYHLDCARYLIEKGADVDNRYDSLHKKGITSLFFAVEGGFSFSRDMIKSLLEMGASTEILDDWGNSLLGEAVKKKTLSSEIVGATGNINLADSEGKTALHYAASEGSVRALNQLFKRDDLDLAALDKWGRVPLFYSHNSLCTTLLVKSGAPVDRVYDRSATCSAV